MKLKEISTQVKVGIFVLTGLILFLVAVAYIGMDKNLFSRTFTLYSTFRSVEGLQTGNNVWLSGVKIGTVKSVTIAGNDLVVVEMKLNDRQNTFISKDAVANIGSDGLVGSKIVVIRPGQARAVVQEYDTIKSTSPVDTQEIIDMAQDVGKDFQSLTRDLNVLINKFNRGDGVVGDLLNDGPLAQDLRIAIDNAKTTVATASRATQEINMLTAEVRNMVEEMRNGSGIVTAMLKDTSWTRSFEQTIQNMEQISSKTAAISGDLERLSANINDTGTPIGMLMGDTAVANNLQEAISSAQLGAEKFDENMEALQNNFFLRGFFRRKEKREKKEREEVAQQQTENQTPTVKLP